MTFGHYRCCTTSGCACAHPREPRRGSSDLGSHPVVMLLLLRKKRGEKAGHAQNLLPVRAPSGHVTLPLPVKKAPLGRIWRNFRLRMRRTYFMTGHVTDVTFGHVNNGTSGHVTNVTSGHVTSGSTPSNMT